jgi:hypothetical protein
MRKLALLFAAALLVSAPFAATTSTDSYAAAKAKAKAAKGGGDAKAAKESPEQANSAFIRALSGDVSRVGASDEGGGKAGKAGKAGKTAKAKKGKKSKKG